jgi:hypothetical protein
LRSAEEQVFWIDALRIVAVMANDQIIRDRLSSCQLGEIPMRGQSPFVDLKVPVSGIEATPHPMPAAIRLHVEALIWR